MKALFLSPLMLLVLFFLPACSSKPSSPTPTPVPTTSASPTTLPPVLFVCVEVANVRTGPGTNYPVLKTLTQGTSIAPLQKSGEWYYLGQDDAKNDSYINESVVCAQPGASVTPESSSAAPSCPTGCTEPPTGCVIKGNISSKTLEKIYYLPGDPGYDQTVIDPDYGERWFCTEAEAQANGWRRVGR
jgi:hypothetical protein